MKFARRNKKRIMIVSFVMLLFFVTIGYASIATGLFINGTVDITSSSWDVHFDNIHITDGSATYSTEIHPYVPVTLDSNSTSINYSVSFFRPGDFYEFTFDVVNNGSLDAKIDDIYKFISNEEYYDFIDYTVIDIDTGLEPSRGDLLAAGSVRHLKVRFDYNEPDRINMAEHDEVVLSFGYRLNYVQL